MQKNWSVVGKGIQYHKVDAHNNIHTMVTYKDDLYAAGFTIAGGVIANYIAKWNGAEWSALGKGRDVITQMAEYKDIIYTGGYEFKGKKNIIAWMARLGSKAVMILQDFPIQ